MKIIIQIVSFIMTITSLGWVYFQFDWESIIAFLGSVIIFLGTSIERKETKYHISFNTFFSSLRKYYEKLLIKILAFRYRRKPGIFTEKFHIYYRDMQLEQKVYATYLFKGDEQLEYFILSHKSECLDIYDFDVINGHSPKITKFDFDGDRMTEIAIQYHCGAHTTCIKIYKFDEYGILKFIEGSHIGSDFGEITWEDRDNDLRYEIYSKNRNWNSNTELYEKAPFVESKYILIENKYFKQ